MTLDSLQTISTYRQGYSQHTHTQITQRMPLFWSRGKGYQSMCWLGLWVGGAKELSLYRALEHWTVMLSLQITRPSSCLFTPTLQQAQGQELCMEGAGGQNPSVVWGGRAGPGHTRTRVLAGPVWRAGWCLLNN